jgi:hypothetical protein
LAIIRVTVDSPWLTDGSTIQEATCDLRQAANHARAVLHTFPRVAHSLESFEAGVVAVVGDAIFNDCNENPRICRVSRRRQCHHRSAHVISTSISAAISADGRAGEDVALDWFASGWDNGSPNRPTTSTTQTLCIELELPSGMTRSRWKCRHNIGARPFGYGTYSSVLSPHASPHASRSDVDEEAVKRAESAARATSSSSAANSNEHTTNLLLGRQSQSPHQVRIRQLKNLL